MNKEDIFEYFINDFDKNGSELGSAFSLLKTKTLIVKDLEGLLVVPPGLEPGTNWLWVSYSNHLSYRTNVLI